MRRSLHFYRTALRLQRAGIIATAGIALLNGLAQASAYSMVAGRTEAERLTFAASMRVLGRQLSYIVPLPTHVETLAGYVQWRVFGFLPLLLWVWAAFAAAGAGRGDEDRGFVESWLAAGISRGAYVAIRMLAFSTGAVAVVGTSILGVALGGRNEVSLAGMAADGIAAVCLGSACFGIALLLAQLTANRASATTLIFGVLLALFLSNGLARGIDGAGAWQAISPFQYYDRTQALYPDGRFDPAATAVLLLTALGAATLAWLAFSRRDLGSALLRRRLAPGEPGRTASRNPLLPRPLFEQLYEQRIGILLWTGGLALLSLFFVSITKATIDLLLKTPSMAPYLAAIGHGNPEEALLGYSCFGFLALLISVHAITHVARWAADDAEGRLEMLLATPMPRTRVVVERALAAALAMLFIAGLVGLVIGYDAAARGIRLPAGDLARAALMLVPLGLLFAGVGAGVAAVRPRLAVPVLGLIAVSGYFIQQLGPIFNLPAWVGRLSVFQLYGNPMTAGVDTLNLLLLVGVASGGFAVALVAMQRREVGS